jgi:hypothetical protein
LSDIAALKLHRKSKASQSDPSDPEEDSAMHEILLEGLRIEESQSVPDVSASFLPHLSFVLGLLSVFLLQKSSPTVLRHSSRDSIHVAVFFALG